MSGAATARFEFRAPALIDGGELLRVLYAGVQLAHGLGLVGEAPQPGDNGGGVFGVFIGVGGPARSADLFLQSVVLAFERRGLG